jgi:galactokinase
MIVSTPGRICLFGEHQDYLGLPVIAASISLRIQISGHHIPERKAIIRMPDIQEEDSFPLTEELPYRHARDYLRSSLHLLLRRGYSFSKGVQAEVRSSIPINSGTSSSSALVVTWLHFLSRMSDQNEVLKQSDLAALAHQAEVQEFSEPGGTMDHYSTAIGGVIHLEPGTPPKIEPMHPALGPFVIGDSGEPKDTKQILSRVKDGILDVSKRMSSLDPDFSLATLSAENLHSYDAHLTSTEYALLAATIENRDITRTARNILQTEPIDHDAVGKLLHKHQSFLRNPLGISTPKIDSMIQAAYDAGALGAKINGSGGGGCMFAYAPEDPEEVKRALQPYGQAWIVEIGEGTHTETPTQ